MEDVIELMRRDISIQIPRVTGRERAGSFTVGFAADNARTAMQVTERLASQFITESLQDRTVQADQTSQFLETQLEEARRKLADHEQKFAQFRQRYAGELPTQVQSNLAVMQSTQTQLQAVADTINRDRDRQLVLDKNDGRPGGDQRGDTSGTRHRGIRQAVPPTAAEQLEAARAALRGAPAEAQARASGRRARDARRARARGEGSGRGTERAGRRRGHDCAFHAGACGSEAALRDAGGARESRQAHRA